MSTIHAPFKSRRSFLQTMAAVGVGTAATRLTAQEKIILAPPDAQPADVMLPEPVKRKLGWAIVGLGKLAIEEILPAFAESKYSKPTALVSGHPDKAGKIADYYGIGQEHIYNYDNYDKLANDETVDVIYIVLPNSMHAEFTIRGLKAGKHVFCEKPMAGNVEECEQMIKASQETGKKLGIAYRLHYEPMNMKVMQLCKDKAFGDIKLFSSSNCQDVKAPNIRLSKELDGGPLGDIGIYSINAARYCIGQEPTEVFATAYHGDDVRFREVPQSVAYTMKYPGDILASCECSFSTTESRRFRVVGTEGFVEMDPSFSYRGLKLFSQNAEKQLIQHSLPQVDHFASEMDNFSQCVLQNRETKTPGEMGLLDAKIIAALRKSIESGRVETV